MPHRKENHAFDGLGWFYNTYKNYKEIMRSAIREDEKHYPCLLKASEDQNIFWTYRKCPGKTTCQLKIIMNNKEIKNVAKFENPGFIIHNGDCSEKSEGDCLSNAEVSIRSLWHNTNEKTNESKHVESMHTSTSTPRCGSWSMSQLLQKITGL